MDVQEIFRWENGAYANAIGNSGNYWKWRKAQPQFTNIMKNGK
jgi:hypothetical protein